MSENTNQDAPATPVENGVVSSQRAFIKSQLQVDVNSIEGMTHSDAKAVLERLISGEDRPTLRNELLERGATDTRQAQRKDYSKLFNKAYDAATKAADEVTDEDAEDIGLGIDAAVVIDSVNHGMSRYMIENANAFTIRERGEAVEVEVKGEKVKRYKFNNSVLMPISASNSAKAAAAAQAFATVLTANKVPAKART